MPETSGFFNAQLVEGEPDRAYEATDFANYYANLIGNGVFANPSNQLKAVSNEFDGLSIRLTAGNAYINGYWYNLSEDIILDFESNNSAVTRWDNIIISLDLNLRQISAKVVKGTSGAYRPTPVLIRDEFEYQLCIAQVSILKGMTKITDSQIYDLRGDTRVCGWVTGLVNQIDTTDLFSQYDSEFSDWFNTIQNKLSDNTAGKLQAQIDELSGAACRSQISSVVVKEDENTQLGESSIVTTKTQVYSIESCETTNELAVKSAKSPEDISGIKFLNPGWYRINLGFMGNLHVISTFSQIKFNDYTQFFAPELSFGLLGSKSQTFIPIVKTRKIYEELSSPSEAKDNPYVILKGDVDFDGKITSIDASAIETEYISGKPKFTPEQRKAADVDNNGVIDARDASAVLTEYTNRDKPIRRLGWYQYENSVPSNNLIKNPFCGVSEVFSEFIYLNVTREIVQNDEIWYLVCKTTSEVVPSFDSGEKVSRIDLLDFHSIQMEIMKIQSTAEISQNLIGIVGISRADYDELIRTGQDSPDTLYFVNETDGKVSLYYRGTKLSSGTTSGFGLTVEQLLSRGKIGFAEPVEV